MHHNCVAIFVDNADLLNRSINWNYCILDEGHIIKNTKTKVLSYGPDAFIVAPSTCNQKSIL